MKLTIAIISGAALALVSLLAFRRRRLSGDLTVDEMTIRNLVREVYGANIVSERIERRGSEAVLIAELRNEKLKQLQTNLSSLARKHRDEGVSLPVLKTMMRFD
jgi:hypothetical protein